MTTSDYIAIGGIAVPVLLGAFAWVRRVERRLALTLTYDAHKEICTDNTAEIRRSIDQLREGTESRHQENTGRFEKLFDILERNNEQASQARHRMADQILTLTEKVGSVQGRLGVDEFARNGGRG